MTEPNVPNDPSVPNEPSMSESARPLLPTPKRAWKERLPRGVVTAVDRAFDAADEVADELRKAASDVARAARDATK